MDSSSARLCNEGKDFTYTMQCNVMISFKLIMIWITHRSVMFVINTIGCSEKASSAAFGRKRVVIQRW